MAGQPLSTIACAVPVKSSSDAKETACPAGHLTSRAQTATTRVSGTCLDSSPRAVLSGSGAQGFTAQQRALADEGEVVVTAGGVGDGGAPVGRDAQVGQVGDVAAVDPN